MLILGLLGMYFDAAVVFVTSQTLFLRLAWAILCCNISNFDKHLAQASYNELTLLIEYGLIINLTLLCS